MDKIKKAIEVFNQGGIVIFPTDTAFGIGCRVDKRDAVDKLFHLRRRPLTQAVPILVSSQNMALTYYDSPSSVVRRLMDVYWPGGLTIVARAKKDLLYSPIRGGGNTIGLRMPDQNDLLSVIESIGVPILGPSANFHKLPTPYRFIDLDSELIKLVDYVMPGRCKTNQPSTVVDCSTTTCTILRQGSVVVQPEDLS